MYPFSSSWQKRQKPFCGNASGITYWAWHYSIPASSAAFTTSTESPTTDSGAANEAAAFSKTPSEPTDVATNNSPTETARTYPYKTFSKPSHQVWTYLQVGSNLVTGFRELPIGNYTRLCFSNWDLIISFSCFYLFIFFSCFFLSYFLGYPVFIFVHFIHCGFYFVFLVVPP